MGSTHTHGLGAMKVSEAVFTVIFGVIYDERNVRIHVVKIVEK